MDDGLPQKNTQGQWVQEHPWERCCFTNLARMT